MDDVRHHRAYAGHRVGARPLRRRHERWTASASSWTWARRSWSLAGVDAAGIVRGGSRCCRRWRATDWAGREVVSSRNMPRDPILTGTEFMSMVRTREWKLVHFLDDPAGQLFNYARGPGRGRESVGRRRARRGEARAAGRAARMAHSQPVPDGVVVAGVAVARGGGRRRLAGRSGSVVTVGRAMGAPEAGMTWVRAAWIPGQARNDMGTGGLDSGSSPE